VDKNTTITVIVVGVLALALMWMLSRPRPAAVSGAAPSNGWDAIIGLGKNAVDAYGYA
jgi:hypothetical protein